MGASVQPERYDPVRFAREALRKGFSAEEVAEELEADGFGDYARELRATAGSTGKGVTAGLIDGLFGPLGRPMMAAAGTAVQKLSGDDRAPGDIYRQLRDDVENQATVAPRGGKLAGTVAGAATQAMIPGVRELARVLPGNPATSAGRALQAGTLSGAQTGLQGFLNADADLRTTRGWREAAGDAALWGGLGFGAGALASPLVEGLAAGGSMVAKAVTPEPVKRAAGRAADAVREGVAEAKNAVARGLGRATAPASAGRVDPGAARVLSRMQAQGMTPAQLRQAAQGADDPDMVAELIGDKGVRDLNTALNVGNRAPDEIQQTLEERAADEAGRWVADLQRLTKGTIRDPKTLRARVERIAQAKAAPLYGRTNGRPVPDGAAATVLDEVEALKEVGIDLWKAGRLMDRGFPEAPTEEMTVGQLKRLRAALDQLIDYSGNPAASSAESMAQGRLRALRQEIDGIAKAAGGEDFVAADRIVAQWRRAAEAFEAGATKAKRETTAEGLTRLRDRTGSADAFGKGVASMRMAEVEGLRDGVGGGIQNPFAPAMASPQRRAVTREAMPSEGAMAEAEWLAEQGARRLRTRNEVLGNSATARRVADMAEATGGVPSPMDVAQAAASPAAAGMRGISALWNAGQRRALGDEMDAMAPYLLAGAPGARYTREEAIRRLEEMLPLLQSQWAQQAMRRGALTGAAGRGAMGNR